MRNDVKGYWRKTLVFGFAESVAHELVDRIVDIYRTAEIHERLFKSRRLSYRAGETKSACASISVKTRGVQARRQHWAVSSDNQHGPRHTSGLERRASARGRRRHLKGSTCPRTDLSRWI